MASLLEKRELLDFKRDRESHTPYTSLVSSLSLSVCLSVCLSVSLSLCLCKEAGLISTARCLRLSFSSVSHSVFPSVFSFLRFSLSKKREGSFYPPPSPPGLSLSPFSPFLPPPFHRSLSSPQKSLGKNCERNEFHHQGFCFTSSWRAPLVLCRH